MAGYPALYEPLYSAPPVFPQAELGIRVELLVGSTWTDITGYVFSNPGIGITRGRPDESAFVNPSAMAFKVDNRTSSFSPKNPVGQWYGLIGRNTQCRVSVQAANPADGTWIYRYWGEVAEYPPSWDPTDTDRTMLLQVAGILRRLSQTGNLGTSPKNLGLPLDTFYASLLGTSLGFTGYWPCEDPDGSSQLASGLPGGTPMTFTGAPSLAADSSFPGSAAIPTFGGSTWTALLAGATSIPGQTSAIVDTFTFTQPWVAPSTLATIDEVDTTGGGGGGVGGIGGGSPRGGGGGGGGGISQGLNVAVTGGSSYTVTVGGGGPAGSGSSSGTDGGDSSFPGDSVTITGGGGGGAPHGSGAAGAGGTGDAPGGDGGSVGSGDDSGGGGGGAGGGNGGPGGGIVGGAGGNSGIGGPGGHGGNGTGSTGSPGQTPGGGGGGGGAGSSTAGGAGAGGVVTLRYSYTGSGNVIVSGGPQNANILRFLLGVPLGGDADGAVIASMYTSGTIARLDVVYHGGAAVLSAAVSGTITALPVTALEATIAAGTITVWNSSGQSQQFTTTGASGGATSIPVTSAAVTITTETGDAVTLATNLAGNLELIGYSSTGSVLFDSGSKVFGAAGNNLLVSAELAQSGTAVAWTLQALTVDSATPVAYTGSHATSTCGSVGAIIANPSGALQGTALGQITLQYATSSITTLVEPLAAYEGETAGNRFIRLCASQGITSQVIGDPDDSVMMGPQASDTLVNLLQTCEVADRGLVYEPRDVFGLGYRTRVSMLSQSPGVDLGYATWALTNDPVPVPDYDDQYTSNDVTVQRTGGSQQAATLYTGRLSVQDPPDGVGYYSSSVQEVLATDGQLPDACGWLLHLGTVDEFRWPVIATRMEYAEIAGTALFEAAASVDIGDFVQVSTAPAWVDPDDIKQIAYGLTEAISSFSWMLSWNGVPESPYEVAVSDDLVYGRADTDGSTLHANLTSTATTFSVDSANTALPLWTTSGGDFPFDIAMAGERMTVTGITGSTSPQAFTVTRSVNGVVKSHLAGEDVRLFFPPIASM